MASLSAWTMSTSMLGSLRLITKPDTPGELRFQRGGAAGRPRPHAEEVVTFASFLVAGLVPAFSEFFLAVLNFYGVQLAHLQPNSVLRLAVFAHLCEMYLGITPQSTSLPLLLPPSAHASAVGIIGSYGFCLRTNHEPYLPFPLKSKWDGWVLQWCYVAVNDSQDCVRWPDSPVEAQACWTERLEETAETRALLDHIDHLWDAGLTGITVMTYFKCTPATKCEENICKSGVR